MTEPLFMDQAFIRKLTDIILTNLNNKDFGVKELARESGMSRSGLNRRLNKIINKTISQFIREVRLQKALEMLQNESVTASEVAYKVGFSSPAYFNTCFHEFFGYPPGKIKKRSIESPEEDMLTHVTARQEQKRPIQQTLAFSKLWILFLSVLIVIVAIILYPKILKRKTLDKLRSSGERISVAVMPFQNMTNDTSWNIWQKGIQNNIITSLSSFPDVLKVSQTESVNTLIQSKDIASYASLTRSIARIVSQKLDANVFIFGSIQQAGSKLRISAELVDTKTEEVLRPFEVNGLNKEDSILVIIDSLRKKVTDFLLISKLKEGISPDMQRYDYTYSPVAYRLFLNGNEASGKGDPATALKLYKEAIAIDSNFVVAKIFMTSQYMFLGLYTDAKARCLKIYEQRDHIPMIYWNNVNWLHACLFETPHESIKYLRQDLQSYGDWAVVYGLIGSEYSKLHQFDKAIPEFEKVLKLCKEWDVNPSYASYTTLGFAYHKTGQYKKEKKLYRKAVNDFPGNPDVIFRQTVLALSEEKTKDANDYIEKYKSIRKENSVTEASIMTGVADIYSDANILDKAEEYYRQALLLEPEKSVRMNNLAWFLIDKDRNIDEGLKLIDKALKLFPDSWAMLDTKGWGLYKQDKYQEALKFLQKADSLKPVYSQDLYDHLEAAKKAVANKK